MEQGEYDVCKAKLRAYLTPARNTIAERLAFKTVRMESNEKFEEYLARLRVAANRCGFTGKAVDQEIRNQCLAGTQGKLQERLLQRAAEKGDALTLQDVLAAAVAMERTRALIEQMRGPGTAAESVQLVTGRRLTGFDCGKPGHTKTECQRPRSRCEPVCFRCKKPGHLKRDCQNPRKVCAVQEVTDSHEIWHLQVNREAEDAGHLQPPQVTLDVNGQRMTFVVDTGSPVSIIGSRTNIPRLKLGRSKLVLSSFTGHQIPIKGEADVTVRHGTASASLKIVKVDLPAINLLGRDWISALKLNKGRVRRMCPAGAQVAGGCNQVGVVEQQAREGKARRCRPDGCAPGRPAGGRWSWARSWRRRCTPIHLENVRLRTQMRDMERRLAELEAVAGRGQAATEMPRERNIRYAADDSAARVDDAQRVIRNRRRDGSRSRSPSTAGHRAK